jgi:hypothetical protein
MTSMTTARPRLAPSLGDSHNFGRRVAFSPDGRWVRKPRPVLWEWAVLSASSPLRRALVVAARTENVPDAFDFLPALRFRRPFVGQGGEVERVRCEPLPPRVGARGRCCLASAFGRALALFTWLGLTDLHWENLALGQGASGAALFFPLDVEMILGDFASPVQTKLLPDADPEVAAECRHACGARRLLPYLGKPVSGEDLARLAGAYRATLGLLGRHARSLAQAVRSLPGVKQMPIRVCLRSTGDYVSPRAEGVWPPLLPAESEQVARGDVPYFFRVYGRPGIRYYGDQALRAHMRLPLEGHGPRLDPLLALGRGLASPNRARLLDEGLFAILGAFDHAGLDGRYVSAELDVEFRARRVVVRPRDGSPELSTGRNLSAFVGSVYCPCRCGEVRGVLVPHVTRCSSAVR